MNLDAVIQQIRIFAPVFEGRVAGAADYALAADQIWLQQPAAYVTPLEDDAGENENQTGLYQVVREKIGVVVDLSNAVDPTDRRGQGPVTQAVYQYRAALWAALLNWRPDPVNQARGFAYAGGGLVGGGLTRQWLRWQFDFVVETTVTTADGWHPPSEPLREIQGTVVNQDSGAIAAEFRANPAQT
ncbi:MAG TPA: hypothetical protein VNZ61_08745 [Roseomonas sp.]|nr:hypothetical protein [Roseomonas sp.]